LAVVSDCLVPLSQPLVNFCAGLNYAGIPGRQRNGPIGIGQALGVLARQVVKPDGAIAYNNRAWYYSSIALVESAIAGL
jgi:hypothetical protein